jgi:hypothetical protein
MYYNYNGIKIIKFFIIRLFRKFVTSTKLEHPYSILKFII